MQDHNRSVFSVSLLTGFLAVFGLANGYGQNIVAVGLAGGNDKTYSAEAAEWYRQSGLGYRTVPVGSRWDDIYEKAEFDVYHIYDLPLSSNVWHNTVSVPRPAPCTAKSWTSGSYPDQFIQHTNGTWTLTDTSLTFSKYLDLWLENYAKPCIEYYADKGCYIIDFGTESWPAHYWDTTGGWAEMGNIVFGGDAWYPCDKLSDTPEIPVVAGESNLTALLLSQYAILDSAGDAVLKNAFDQTLWGFRDSTPPTFTQEFVGKSFASTSALTKVGPWLYFYRSNQQGTLIIDEAWLELTNDIVDRVLVDAGSPFTATNGYPYGYWQYNTYGQAYNTLATNTAYHLHVIAHSPDGARLGAMVYGFNTNMTIVETMGMNIWDQSLQGVDTNVIAQIFETAEQLRIKDDYIAGKIRNTYKQLYEWKMQHFPKVVIAFSTHGNFLETLKNHANEVQYVDWFGPDYTPTALSIFTNQIYYPLASVIQNTSSSSNKIWGMGTFEDIVPVTSNEMGLAGTPYAGNSLCQYNVMTKDGYRCGSATFQKLCDHFYDVDHANNYIKCFFINRAFQSQKYGDINSATPPDVGIGWGDQTKLAPWTFVDSDEPLGTTINPRAGETNLDLALWDGDADGSIWDLDDPVLELRGLGNRWGRGNPPLNESGYPITNIYASKYSYLVYKMYNPEAPAYSYWRVPYPIVVDWASCSYDYQSQEFVLALQNIASPVPLSADCLVFPRQSFSPPWTNSVRAKPEDLEAALPAPQYAIAGNSYSIAGKVFNSLQQPENTFTLTNYPSVEGRYCFVFLKDQPGVKGLAQANEITQFSYLELKENAHLQGYLDVRNIIDADTEDVISVRVVVRDSKGFATASPVMQKHVSLIYGGRDFIPISYALSDSDGGIAGENIDFKRSGDTNWFTIAREELLAPVYFPEVVSNKVVVAYDMPFVATNLYACGYWQYRPGSTLAQNVLATNTTYRLHIVAHSSDGAQLGTVAYGFSTNWAIVESMWMDLWGVTLDAEPREFVGNEFISTSPLTKVGPLVYIYRSNQQGTLNIDKAWLEITDDHFEDGSSYQIAMWGNPDPLLAYRLHVVARSPDSAAKFGALAIGYDGYGYNYNSNRVESYTVAWDEDLTPLPQEYITDVFYMKDIATLDELVCMYRSNQAGTLIIEKAWLSVEGLRPTLIELIAPSAGLIADSGYSLKSYAFDIFKTYQLSVVALSTNGAQLGVLANGYKSSGSWVEGQGMGIWNYALSANVQQIVGSSFYLHNTNAASGCVSFYRSNQAGTLNIKRAWLTLIGDRP